MIATPGEGCNPSRVVLICLSKSTMSLRHLLYPANNGLKISAYVELTAGSTKATKGLLFCFFFPSKFSVVLFFVDFKHFVYRSVSIWDIMQQITKTTVIEKIS